jgi:hypothetical protein
MASKKAPEPALLDAEAKVIELRRAGLTWATIAKETGYSGPSGAYKAYQRAAERLIRPNLEEYRDMEIDRLDRLQAGVWQSAAQGNVKSIDAVLRIINTRARLLGLEAPQKIQAEVTTYDGSELEERTRHFIALIREANGSQGSVGSGLGEDRAITG